MANRKSVCVKWTLFLLVVSFCQFVYSRPQDTSSPNLTTSSVQADKTTENPIRESSTLKQEETKKTENLTTSVPAPPNDSRNSKNKTPIIGESIKLVANQLLENPSNTTVEPVVIDTRIPPKLKPIVQKHKIKTRNEDGDEPIDNSHPGVAVPITMEELESENKVSESSTSNEGISTWVLLSNTFNKENSSSTEASKIEDPQKKQKPNNKNKTKRPSTNKNVLGKRPIIGSTNKSDLVAGGSAINENVYNKIKDTVLSNVQKNKNQSLQKTTTVSTTMVTTTTTVSPTTEIVTTKKEVSQSTKAPAPLSKVTSKPSKKKNKNKNKTTSTTPSTIDKESALLPMEPKEQEIELEISTPATTTKKPKRSSTKKKNKTKKRKTSKPKPESTQISEVKTSNKTKTKKEKKPDLTSITGPITSSIYSYFSREVMPTVGVGVLSLAGLVGLAGYFLYPFSTPVRRTFEVDKKDDIYRHNAEEYANEGNGQAEEEMLGTVLAGMPAHSKHKLNPYAGQTSHINRYPVKKEQDIRYRHVAAGSAGSAGSIGYEPNYNVHYPQQKTGIAHGAVYSEPYNSYQYEMRHVYSTEGKYVYDKGPNGYTPHPAQVEPIYAAPQAGSQTGPSGYGSDTSNSVVYGVKPSSDSDFKPVYPFETQFYSETTSSPITYPPTSMYLGSNNDAEEQEEQNYSENSETNIGSDENKFVVGNVPKELSETATPAVVPEHGPRKLRRRRNIRRKRSIATKIEEILKEAKNKNNEIFISNEIDETSTNPVKKFASMENMMKNDVAIIPEVKDVYTVFAVSSEPIREDNITEVPTTEKTEVIESVSTVPIENNREKITTEVDGLETTTKSFRVYEVFSSSSPYEADQSSTITSLSVKAETTTQVKNMNTETTTELKSETTSTMPPSPSPVFSTTGQSFTTNNPEVLTYPPLNEGGFFTFLKRLIEFKYRLGLSILQTTSENLNRYLRSMEHSVKKISQAST